MPHPLLPILVALAASRPQDVVLDARADALRPFVGEVIALEFEFEAATEFLEGSVAPRTLRRLDRALAFESGALALESGTPGAVFEAWSVTDDPAGVTCVLDGAVVRASRALVADERERLRIVARARVRSAEPFELAPAVEYAVARDRGDDLFGGSLATDLEVVRHAGPVLAFEPRPLPSDGAGLAVGVFELEADAALPARVAVDERFTVVARVRGSENLGDVGPPTLAGGEAFHVLGVLASRVADVLEWRYDVLLVGHPREPLALRLATFDPTGDGRRVDHVWPVEVTVTGAPPVDPAPGAAPVSAPPARPSARQHGALVAGGGAALVGLAVFVVVRVARGTRSAAARRDAAERRARARARFEHGDPAAALERFVASYFDLAPGSLSGPTLAATLAGRGVASELAARVADHVARAQSARYRAADETERAALAAQALQLSVELERTGP